MKAPENKQRGILREGERLVDTFFFIFSMVTTMVLVCVGGALTRASAASAQSARALAPGLARARASARARSKVARVGRAPSALVVIPGITRVLEYSSTVCLSLSIAYPDNFEYR